jgi:hypothetical protein
MKTTIELAREAAGAEWYLFREFMPEIHRFAELVRASERARMEDQLEEDLYDLAVRADNEGQP